MVYDFRNDAFFIQYLRIEYAGLFRDEPEISRTYYSAWRITDDPELDFVDFLLRKDERLIKIKRNSHRRIPFLLPQKIFIQPFQLIVAFQEFGFQLNIFFPRI